MLLRQLQSAEDFAQRINNLLTDDKQHQLSKEMIKQLFSIDIENDISRSLFVKKVQKPVVPEEIADMFECPEVIIVARYAFVFSNFRHKKNVLFHFSWPLKETSKN